MIIEIRFNLYRPAISRLHTHLGFHLVIVTSFHFELCFLCLIAHQEAGIVINFAC